MERLMPAVRSSARLGGKFMKSADASHFETKDAQAPAQPAGISTVTGER
jgi:hypothetical protein